jgi:hypothetical protein
MIDFSCTRCQELFETVATKKAQKGTQKKVIKQVRRLTGFNNFVFLLCLFVALLLVRNQFPSPVTKGNDLLRLFRSQLQKVPDLGLFLDGTIIAQVGPAEFVRPAEHSTSEVNA